MLLMGTKLDIVKSNETWRQVRVEEARSLASLKHMMGVIETSSKEDTNISRTFVDLVSMLIDKHERFCSIADGEKSITLSTVNIKEDKKCPC